MANVLNYGADPTGVANSTAAILAAIAATPVSGTVCFPYTAVGGTYLCDPDTINAAGRRLQKDAAHATNVSTLRARIAGTSLLISSSECAVEYLRLDGNSLVTNGLALTGADRSEITGVEARNCTGYGFRIVGGERLYIRYSTAFQNANGFYLEGGKDAEFYGCSANFNDTIGLHAVVGADPATDPCNFKWYGGGCDANTAGPQILLDGVRNCLISGPYVEGASPGIRLDNEAINNCFEFIRFVVGDAATDMAFELLNASGNSFFGCSAPGTNGRRIWIDSNLSAYNTVVGCYRASYLASDYMTVFLDDGGGTTWAAEQREAGLTAAAAPTIGTWSAGDIVFNNAAGAPTGWRFDGAVWNAF